MGWLRLERRGDEQGNIFLSVSFLLKDLMFIPFLSGFQKISPPLWGLHLLRFLPQMLHHFTLLGGLNAMQPLLSDRSTNEIPAHHSIHHWLTVVATEGHVRLPAFLVFGGTGLVPSWCPSSVIFLCHILAPVPKKQLYVCSWAHIACSASATLENPCLLSYNSRMPWSVFIAGVSRLGQLEQRALQEMGMGIQTQILMIGLETDWGQGKYTLTYDKLHW